MDLFSLPPITAILDAAYGALMWIAAILEPLTGAASAAVAVVLVTLVVRAALIPVGISQAKAEQTRARLAPKLRALQERYKSDRERLQRETMKLYSEEGASPLAGCAPVLAQAPVVGLIYALFLHTAIAGHTNALLTERLFGVPLGTSVVGLISHGSVTWPAIAIFGALVALIAAVGEVTRRALSSPNPGRAGTPSGAPAALRLLGVLHYATAVAAIFVPLAAGLYLLVTVSWTLVQRIILRSIYPLPAP